MKLNLHTIVHVFNKDFRELIRDRRTLFVNVVLPVLLYPVMALFFLQVAQLTKPKETDVPTILTLDAPEALVTELPTPQRAKDIAEKREAAINLTGAAKHEIVKDAAADSWREALSGFWDRHHKKGTQHSILLGEAEQAPLLKKLRDADALAILAFRPDDAVRPGSWRSMWLIDDASRHAASVSSQVSQALDRFEAGVVDNRLAGIGEARQFIEPLMRRSSTLAPPAEATRSRLAGIIPIILIMMALSGAFVPALDLIAGERERGTLESLLCWPGGRAEIFLGKLLVVICAATVTVVLNLASLGITVAIIGGQLQQAQGGGGLSIELSLLPMAFLTLLPLIIMLSSISLALAGIASSFKEAQNYLSPLFLVVMVPAMTVMMPNAKPSWALDLVPLVGPLLALKESMQSPTIPWGHLLVAIGASTALTAVVVAWSVRLLEQERFLYPSLVRAGWGRWRRWGEKPTVPGGLEAMAVYAVAVGAFLGIGGFLGTSHPALRVAAPLVLCIMLPALLFTWLGAYNWRETLGLRSTAGRNWLLAIIAIPLAVLMSMSINQLQQLFLGAELKDPVQLRTLEQLMHAIFDSGGWVLVLLTFALAPGICEEVLCRGPLLAGLRKGIGVFGAVLVSSFCFAVLHGHPWRFFPQFAVGIVLAVLVIRSGSLWPAILLHVGHNASLMLLMQEDGLITEEQIENTSLRTWSVCLLVAAGGLAMLMKALRASIPRASASGARSTEESAGPSEPSP